MGFGGLKSGVGGVFSYADFASLPTGVKDGTVAVTLDNSGVYVYDSDTDTWYGPGGGGVISSAENFSYKRVATGVTVTIPLYQQMIVTNDITIDGTLIQDGELYLLGV